MIDKAYFFYYLYMHFSIASMIAQVSQWLTGLPFMLLLISTGLLYTIYLGLPQVRYFVRSFKILIGLERSSKAIGETSPFQALATSLASSIGGGSIIGVAIAMHIGGPSSLVWMWLVAFFGMATRMAEATASHLSRIKTPKGDIVGGPMYLMKKKLGKPWLGITFALGTFITSFLAGNMPQVNAVANVVYFHWGIGKLVTGGIITFLVGLVIIGGIKRIGQVTALLVPFMSLIYLILVLWIIAYNYTKIFPAFSAIFSAVLQPAPAVGGFVGANVSAITLRGMKCGFFTNEAGIGSSAIAHSASQEPISGRVGIMSMIEPFISTCCMCTLTSLAILVSGSWQEKVYHTFDLKHIEVVIGHHASTKEVRDHVLRKKALPSFSGYLTITQGHLPNADILLLHTESIAEEVMIYKVGTPFSGIITVSNGRIITTQPITIKGKSLLTAANLAFHTFASNPWGSWIGFLMLICLLLFCFSTIISFFYFGSSALTYLGGTRYILLYKILYVVLGFFAAILQVSLLWEAAVISCAMMAIPNLISLWMVRKEVKTAIEKRIDA